MQHATRGSSGGVAGVWCLQCRRKQLGAWVGRKKHKLTTSTDRLEVYCRHIAVQNTVAKIKFNFEFCFQVCKFIKHVEVQDHLDDPAAATNWRAAHVATIRDSDQLTVHATAFALSMSGW